MGPRRAQVIAKAKAGQTVRQIAYDLGITTQAVYKHLKAAGISPKAGR